MNPNPFKKQSNKNNQTDDLENFKNNIEKKASSLSKITDENKFITETLQLLDEISQRPKLDFKSRVFILKNIMFGCLPPPSCSSSVRTELTTQELSEKITNYIDSLLSDLRRPEDIKTNIDKARKVLMQNLFLSLVNLFQKNIVKKISIEKAGKLQACFLDYNDKAEINDEHRITGMRALLFMTRNNLTQEFHLDKKTLIEFENIIKHFANKNTNYKHIGDLAVAVTHMANMNPPYLFSQDTAKNIMEMFEAHLNRKLTVKQFVDILPAFGVLANQEQTTGIHLFEFSQDTERQIAVTARRLISESCPVGALQNIISALSQLSTRKKLESTKTQIFDSIQQTLCLILDTNRSKHFKDEKYNNSKVNKHLQTILWKFKDTIKETKEFESSFDAKLFFEKLIQYISNEKLEFLLDHDIYREIYLYMIEGLFKPNHLAKSQQILLEKHIVKWRDLKSVSHKNIMHMLNFIKELIEKQFIDVDDTLYEAIKPIIATALQHETNEIKNLVSNIYICLKQLGYKNVEVEVKETRPLHYQSESNDNNHPGKTHSKPLGSKGSSEDKSSHRSDKKWKQESNTNDDVDFFEMAKNNKNMFDVVPEKHIVSGLRELRLRLIYSEHQEYDFDLTSFLKQFLNFIISISNNNDLIFSCFAELAAFLESGLLTASHLTPEITQSLVKEINHCRFNSKVSAEDAGKCLLLIDMLIEGHVKNKNKQHALSLQILSLNPVIKFLIERCLLKSNDYNDCIERIIYNLPIENAFALLESLEVKHGLIEDLKRELTALINQTQPCSAPEEEMKDMEIEPTLLEKILQNAVSEQEAISLFIDPTKQALFYRSVFANADTDQDFLLRLAKNKWTEFIKEFLEWADAEELQAYFLKTNMIAKIISEAPIDSVVHFVDTLISINRMYEVLPNNYSKEELENDLIIRRMVDKQLKPKQHHLIRNSFFGIQGRTMKEAARASSNFYFNDDSSAASESESESESNYNSSSKSSSSNTSESESDSENEYSSSSSPSAQSS